MLKIGDIIIESTEPVDSSFNIDDKIHIMFCIPGRSFSKEFLGCWTDTIMSLVVRGIPFNMSNEYSSVVHFARTMCLGADVLRGVNQKPFDGKIDYTHACWIDSDIVWSPDQIFQLLSRNVDIVSAFYSQYDRSKFVAVKNMRDMEFFKKHGYFENVLRKDIEGKKDLMPLDYNGMGLFLITRKALESLKYPWFKPLNITVDENIEDISSEDVAFCQYLRDQNFKIYGDPQVIVGHEKNVIIR